MRKPGPPLILVVLALLAAVAGCSGTQSALEPTGAEASRIHALFWALTIFCAAVFLGVAVLAAMALFGSGTIRNRLGSDRLVIGGGIVFPVVSLTLLLAYGIYVMSLGGSSAEAGGGLRISVIGERWWWRVVYHTPDGRRIESANELRLPVGQPVPVELTSADVIHSFWVPRLAGKLDMIPGRTNTLTLDISEPGISRGQCAEYCGGPHALMSFFVIAMPQEEFSAWLNREAAAAKTPETEDEIQGQSLFLASGCGACHAVRGSQANGVIGPDLTHVGSRHSLAAASLPNNAGAFMRWIRDGQHIKPENLMPPYGIFTETQLRQLSAYLENLE
ncbi:cytochrome c oxidase subunit 2 [Mesorhizobium sp. J18]|uniref:cytochrome c oxidase subunit II n=1 Tax=Mesorhizobium sp. J18 TaxID=935263 RepID=UPI0011999CFD|nr:c-type cytochrome [Mesorhizobium sp. J18]TWG91031.1 cytochrome c oxidase subunit 2 [Mesorhizobium sp. J18]